MLQFALLTLLMFTVVATGTTTQSKAAEDSPRNSAEVTQAELQTLVRQLGSDRYLEREVARRALLKIGMPAIDVLYEAQNDDDVEIRFAAETLLGEIRSQYYDANSSPDIVRLMKDFAGQTQVEKRTRLSRLTALDPEEVVVVLCRVARYELDEKTSRRAALYLFQAPFEKVESGRVAELVSSTIGGSPRVAAKWLRAWRESLVEGDAAMSKIEAIATAELKQITMFPDDPGNDREIVAELTRWLANRYFKSGDQERAFSLYGDLLSVMDGNTIELLADVSWLTENEAWDFIVRTFDAFPVQFDQNALLLYYTALAHRQKGNTDKADQFAQRALGLTLDNDREHLQIGSLLRERGLRKYAEMEFRKTIELTQLDDIYNRFARSILAEMLADAGDPDAGADVLQELVEEMIEDEEFLERVRDMTSRDPVSIISRYFYFRALHVLRKKNFQRGRELLIKGLEYDPNDLDVLIAMHRLPDADKEWVSNTERQIRATIGKLRDDIEEQELRMIESDDGQSDSDLKSDLASAHNQFAWLACNTIGDFEEALASSHKSLLLLPGTSSYLDTLAHCYYAMDDYENAVKYQKQAVELDKHELILQRKLEHFLRSLEAGRKIPDSF